MGLKERVLAAVQADVSIISDVTDIGEHPGNRLDYLESLGLRKGDLLKLERAGLAIRGYTPNGSADKGFGPGSEVRWVILCDISEQTKEAL